MNRLITIKEIKECLRAYPNLGLKYVRTPKGYVFARTDGEWFPPDHSAMVDQEGRDNVISAAYIEIGNNKLEIDGYSSTLETGRAIDDEENLVKLLGLNSNE